MGVLVQHAGRARPDRPAEGFGIIASGDGDDVQRRPERLELRNAFQTGEVDVEQEQVGGWPAVTAKAAAQEANSRMIGPAFIRRSAVVKTLRCSDSSSTIQMVLKAMSVPVVRSQESELAKAKM